jgi:hypothetical protein
MDEQKEGGLALFLMLASVIVVQDKSGLHPDVANSSATFGDCAGFDFVDMDLIILRSQLFKHKHFIQRSLFSHTS